MLLHIRRYFIKVEKRVKVPARRLAAAMHRCASSFVKHSFGFSQMNCDVGVALLLLPLRKKKGGAGLVSYIRPFASRYTLGLSGLQEQSHVARNSRPFEKYLLWWWQQLQLVYL